MGVVDLELDDARKIVHQAFITSAIRLVKLNDNGQKQPFKNAIHCCAGVGLEQLAKDALGQAVVIGNIKDVSASDIESDLRECLGYAGDAGAGPGAGVICSDEFFLLLEKICEDMKIQSEQSLSLKSFRIEEGHPAYPVFWDFAFAFLREGEGKILICSSSD